MSTVMSTRFNTHVCAGTTVCVTLLHLSRSTVCATVPMNCLCYTFPKNCLCCMYCSSVASICLVQRALKVNLWIYVMYDTWHIHDTQTYKHNTQHTTQTMTDAHTQVWTCTPHVNEHTHRHTHTHARTHAHICTYTYMHVGDMEERCVCVCERERERDRERERVCVFVCAQTIVWLPHSSRNVNCVCACVCVW